MAELGVQVAENLKNLSNLLNPKQDDSSDDDMVRTLHFDFYRANVISALCWYRR